MEIVLNGQSKLLDGPLNVAGLIESLGFAGKRIAVERNGEIVPRSAYAQTMIKPYDRFEIVVAVGGG